MITHPFHQVNLVEWLKTMVANRRAEEVSDPSLEVRPSIRALKRALLVALRCVDPDSEKRPKMGQVVRMLESEEVPYREVIIKKVPTLMYTISKDGCLRICSLAKRIGEIGEAALEAWILNPLQRVQTLRSLERR